MRIKDPKPEVQRLEELVTAIRLGEIRLPKFQRSFVWDKSDMLNLLDSIYNGYPIGSILLWNSSERLKSERSIFGFDVNEILEDVYPTDYLLDGQQRLTTLCGALFWNGNDKNSIWNIHFNLESEKFEYPSNAEAGGYFPLNKLLKTSDFIRQCMLFDNHPNSRLYYSNAEKLLQSIKNYKIAVVKIGDIALEEIAPVFERINSTGRKLTMVDLMRAATWKGGFDLSEAIEGICDAIAKRGFGELADTHVLRSFSASAGFGINKADIDKLRTLSSRDLSLVVGKTTDALMQSLEFLRDVIGLPNLSYLPFSVQLTHLSEYFRLRDSASSASNEELGYWFWRTSVTGYFSGANSGQNSKDLQNVRDFARGFSPTLGGGDAINLASFLYGDFNLRAALSTAFSLMLVSRKPKKTIYGKPILYDYRQELERRNFEDVLKNDDQLRSRNIGQILNPLQILPNAYSSDVTDNDLKDHLLNREALDYLISGDLYNFTNSRRTLIAGHVAVLANEPIVAPVF